MFLSIFLYLFLYFPLSTFILYTIILDLSILLLGRTTSQLTTRM
nr:MAG TPA: hypothetical protein [Caudoviricetes sp.]